MTYIRTHTRKAFDFLNPRAEDVDIEDVAHALSRICRYTGHTDDHYSVAQHSVYVSYAVPPEDAWPALLHDATEAYTGDISKPLKDLLPDFQALEARLEAVVLPALGVHLVPASVKVADNAILLPEMRDQMGLGIQDSHPPIVGWDWLTAKQMFLRRYHQLKWMQS